MKGMLNCEASWPAVNAPMPAKLAWHSEIWPLMPVRAVMDRKMVP